MKILRFMYTSKKVIKYVSVKNTKISLLYSNHQGRVSVDKEEGGFCHRLGNRKVF